MNNGVYNKNINKVQILYLKELFFNTFFLDKWQAICIKFELILKDLYASKYKNITFFSGVVL